MKKIHLYFRTEPRKDRFLPGDRFVIPLIKKVAGKKRKISGVEKVFLNLCQGFERLKVDYDINLPFEKIKVDEPVVVLGDGRRALEGYQQSNPIIAGISLMTHPSEWPNLCQEYPVVKYLQHSKWANDVYIPYYGKDVCQTWPAGIETDKWLPAEKAQKSIDVLIYNKIRWNGSILDTELRTPVLKKLDDLGLSYAELTYGQYFEDEYFRLLQKCKAMVFLCEHESQGIACCQALSMDVPVLAWVQGFCLDPNRFKWNNPVIPATSVPFFDERCGLTFKDYDDFETLITAFWGQVKEGGFSPRKYILENITLEKSAERMLEIIGTVYK